MDEQPRDPPQQPEPTEPAAPVTPSAEPAEPATSQVPPAPETEPTHGWIPPTEGKSNRIVIRVLAGIAAAVLGVLVFTIFIGSQVDPREAAANDFGRRLMEMPEFKARYGDVDSHERAYELGQQLGATAFARLDDPSLLRYWQLQEIVLQNADDSTCAQAHSPDDPGRTGAGAGEDPRRRSVRGAAGARVQGVRGRAEGDAGPAATIRRGCTGRLDCPGERDGS